MLAGLRHDAFVQCHHQQRRIDAAGPSEHGVHEPLMPWHIDEAEVRGGGIGVAKIDGDAAAFFFRQPVRIDAGRAL